MQKILVATPALTGAVSVYYAYSLALSIRLALSHGYDLYPSFLIQESILPMARNELIEAAYRGEYSQTLFIDADQAWEPEALLTTIKSNYDVVAVPVVNKSERLKFNVWLEEPRVLDGNGFVKAYQVGTGFLKLSQQAVTDLWRTNPEVRFRDKTLKQVFEYSCTASSFVGEDIVLSRKLVELGYDIWINSEFTVQHYGAKLYRGVFKV